MVEWKEAPASANEPIEDFATLVQVIQTPEVAFGLAGVAFVVFVAIAMQVRSNGKRRRRRIPEDLIY